MWKILYQNTYTARVFWSTGTKLAWNLSGGGRLTGMHKNKKSKKVYEGSFDDITSMHALLSAWREFRRGKSKKVDVQMFERHFIENLLKLQYEFVNGTYRHGAYQAFKINDPKPRDIHKSMVKDRVMHHLLYKALSPFFFQIFISDSYSCQLGKGTHRALKRFTRFANKVSQNNTKQCFVLKCDIRKFFANIDHGILHGLLKERIADERIVALFERVIESFDSDVTGKGLPLGNLTSQLLVNIYMHEFDMYVKQTQKVKYYIRYADDFVVLSRDRKYLGEVLVNMRQFLFEKLALKLHPNKVSIETLGSGVDFLGWVHFSHHRVLRTATKKRMFRKCNQSNITSYQGMLRHGNEYRVGEVMRRGF
jgi:RNA-directed DNA polymerase